MESSGNDFRKRLARLKRLPDETGTDPSVKERGVGFRWMLFSMVVVCGLMLPALAVIISLKELSTGVMGTQVASLDANVDVNLDESPGFLAGYFGRKLGLYDSPEGPLPYLPEAPEGWVRVTTMDARDPDILDRLKKQWPDRGAYLPLERNLGYNHLGHFIKIYKKPDIESRVLAKKRTRAMYLHPNGEFMSVRIRFTSQKGALGAPDDQAAWIKSLATQEAKSADSDELVERNRLAGYEVTNRTKPVGKSAIRRPIGRSYNIRNGLKVSVPLTHRVVLSVDGITRPNEVGKIIEAVDQRALVKLLD